VSFTTETRCGSSSIISTSIIIAPHIFNSRSQLLAPALTTRLKENYIEKPLWMGIKKISAQIRKLNDSRIHIKFLKLGNNYSQGT